MPQPDLSSPLFIQPEDHDSQESTHIEIRYVRTEKNGLLCSVGRKLEEKKKKKKLPDKLKTSFFVVS
jgi:hypothetical protein